MCSVKKVNGHVYVCLWYRYSFFLWYFGCVCEMLRQCVYFVHCLSNTLYGVIIERINNISFILHCVYCYTILMNIHLGTRNFTLYGWIYVLFFLGTRYCCLFSHKTKSRQFMCGTWTVDTKLSSRKQQGQIIYSMLLSIKSIIPPRKEKIAHIIVTSSSSSYIRSC